MIKVCIEYCKNRKKGHLVLGGINEGFSGAVTHKLSLEG